MDVQFEDRSPDLRLTAIQRPGMVGYLVRSGAAQTEEQASLFLVLIAVAMMIGSAVIFMWSGHDVPSVTVTEEDMEEYIRNYEQR